MFNGPSISFKSSNSGNSSVTSVRSVSSNGGETPKNEMHYISNKGSEKDSRVASHKHKPTKSASATQRIASQEYVLVGSGSLYSLFPNKLLFMGWSWIGDRLCDDELNKYPCYNGGDCCSVECEANADGGERGYHCIDFDVKDYVDDYSLHVTVQVNTDGTIDVAFDGSDDYSSASEEGYYVLVMDHGGKEVSQHAMFDHHRVMHVQILLNIQSLISSCDFEFCVPLEPFVFFFLQYTA